MSACLNTWMLTQHLMFPQRQTPAGVGSKPGVNMTWQVDAVPTQHLSCPQRHDPSKAVQL